MTAHRLTVESVSITLEGVSVPGRGLIAIELAKPRQRYAVLHELADNIEIVSMHEEEDEAVSACKQLAAELERVVEAQEGGRLQ